MNRVRIMMACAACLVMTNAIAYAEISDAENEKLTEQAMQRLERRTLGIADDEHETVGTRALSHAEEVEVEEERARLNKELAEQEEREESSPEEIAAAQKDFFKRTLAVSCKKDETLVQKPLYYTTHSGVFYHPVAMTSQCDKITLNDGSVWSVGYSDRYKLPGWMPSDSIVISANDTWFSIYKFMIYNQTTGDYIEVNMLEGPLFNGMNTHWIISIDYYNQQVILEDGTLWQISPSDYSVMKRWLVNDTVMIGVNNSWFSSYANILINVKVLNYSCATCIK